MATREAVAAFMKSLGVCDSVIADEAGYVAEHYQESEGEDPFGVVRGSLPAYMNRCHGAGVDALDPTEARESTSFPYQPPPSVYVPPVRLPAPNAPPVIINGAGPLGAPTGSVPSSSFLPTASGPFTSTAGSAGLFGGTGIGGIPTWVLLAGAGVALYFVMKGKR